MDFQALNGTNCYCDGEAAAAIERGIADLPVQGIHFIDSGNYHYVTLFWIRRIREPFRLVVFDNHTDMQPPAFGGLLSCGGWIAAALEELPLLKEVVLVGPDQEAFAQVDPELQKKVRFLSREELAEGKTGRFMDFFRTSGPSASGAEADASAAELPYYISVDKDVLCPGEALTTWSQGDMKLKELVQFLEPVLTTQRILGMDVCGEADPDQAGEAGCNAQANRVLLDLWNRCIML